MLSSNEKGPPTRYMQTLCSRDFNDTLLATEVFCCCKSISSVKDLGDLVLMHLIKIKWSNKQEVCFAFPWFSWEYQWMESTNLQYKEWSWRFSPRRQQSLLSQPRQCPWRQSRLRLVPEAHTCPRWSPTQHHAIDLFHHLLAVANSHKNYSQKRKSGGQHG